MKPRKSDLNKWSRPFLCHKWVWNSFILFMTPLIFIRGLFVMVIPEIYGEIKSLWWK